MEYTSSFSSSSSYDLYDVSDLEAGFSCNGAKASHSSKQTPKSRRGASIFCEPSDIDGEQHHFLDTCFLCKKLLSRNRDIFMYRGDTPFCSEECRNEQIVIDEAKEKGWKHSSEKQKQKKQQNQSSQRITVWAW
ncbi:hypothetical protein LUZ62_069526 [Rhynchospora pubera]|uniref:FLZ-type domain-containing protein n=1 Tax=Rhynchospora pubera TaxID=906938 RepID=A0AAV8BTH2_9POAL|nr:hypothetical protein LUZ62_080885 [Rhynchospora pubera]KAJ4759151.1 hypothetical protein LUZ62_069526 [Rhynchospora pubera]